ncbi:MAG: putative RecB family nuclease [Rhodothermales bacterium]
MQLTQGILLLSASDLTNHLGCDHLTELNRAVTRGELEKPHYKDHALELLQARGLRFEGEFVDHLRRQGTLHDLREDRDKDDPEGQRLRALDKTRKAMASGVDFIVQATLQTGRWRGVADVLRRVPGASTLGDWHYEPIDTKLATETRGATVLQLCLYAELVGDLQGQLPEQFHVVKPRMDWALEEFRFEDYSAYYRLVRQQLETTVAGPPVEDTYPDPVEKCDTCRWYGHCSRQRRADDHLSLVAGMSKLQIGELGRQDVVTLEGYAERTEPLRERPSRGSRESYDRTHRQARVQLQGRRTDEPVVELIDHDPERGLSQLPTPDPGDVFFDIESDGFVEDGGLEYLFGLWLEDGGTWVYERFWGLNHAEERIAFEGLVDFLMARWETYPDFRIYHYSPYDKAAVSRLMGRHGTRETEVDRLLRGRRFVDIMAITKQGIRASVEGYGLKDMEPLIGYVRQTPLEDARNALRVASWALELGRPEDLGDEERGVIEEYNREDCEATAELRAWLEERRAGLVTKVGAIERPIHTDGRAKAVEEVAEEIQVLFDQLVDGIAADPDDRSPEEQARWLLAHMLEYHRREEKVTMWEKFFRADLDAEGLERDRHGIAGLKAQETVGLSKTGLPTVRYAFSEQEVSLKEGKDVWMDADRKLGSIADFNLAGRTVDIKQTGKTAEDRPTGGFIWGSFGAKVQKAAVLELGRQVVEAGVAGAGPNQAQRDLLLGSAPRLKAGGGGTLRRDGEPLLEAAIRLASDLDHSVLPIQGPPGSGKTYVGARMILDLVKRGKRVGVTAVSHKVIENLLCGVLDAASEAGDDLEVSHKYTDAPDDLPEAYKLLKSNAAAISALDEGRPVGGTTFLWAREDMADQLDYLFVDEAGQMALANTLAVGQAAKNIVLLGDPQQLEQPQRGSHPEGAEVATLVHVLDGQDTISDKRGLFLDETWRLHPDVCRFTSEVYYDGRLVSRPEMSRQRIDGPTRFAGTGLFHEAVRHSGNQSNSVEEVEAIGRIVDELTASGVTWTDQDGVTQPLLLKDILIVAPYNSQVGSLTHALEGARVGTVDKFQGQEAPVVIYSMTSSSAADAPRGMSFLYSPNRLNVATSRARCICILVASPAILEPECRTPEQMRWANGVCRFGEIAGERA